MKKKKAKTKLPAVVEKVIKSPYEAEKAQISVKDADDLYKEIRVQNVLKDESGQKVKLIPGAELEVTLEADSEATAPADAPSEPSKKED